MTIAPLTPADCDLRGMPFMPLEVGRLLDSDLYALSTGDEFKAALTLWCRSWTQAPAGSLPCDDRILAKLAGCSLREWAAVKEMALHGWKLCSDSRLYHPVVAEQVAKAWAHREAQRARAKRRWSKGDEAVEEPREVERQSDGSAAGNAVGNAAACPAAMQGTVNGKVREEAVLGSARADGEPEPDWPEGVTAHWAAKLAQLAGPGLGDPHRFPELITSAGEIARWRLSRCSWLEDVVPTIQRLTRKPRREPIRSWSYFTEAVMTSLAERNTPIAIPIVEAGAAQTDDRPSPSDTRRDASARSLQRQLAAAMEDARSG